MIEENVVSAAGAHNSADEKMLRFLISEAGFIPQQRDILYKHVNRETLPESALPNPEASTTIKITHSPAAT
jgi:2-iminoacetate synthase ThiH